MSRSIDLFSDSETSYDPLFESFLNSNFKRREMEKLKRIQVEALDKLQKVERKPKRKSPKKSKVDTVENPENVKDLIQNTELDPKNSEDSINISNE